MHYWLVIIPMTMKLCHRGMPTKTFNIHDLHVCKQQQIASDIKNLYTNNGYNLVVLVKLGALVYTQYHSNVKTTFTTTTNSPQALKTCKLMFMAITWLGLRS